MPKFITESTEQINKMTSISDQFLVLFIQSLEDKIHHTADD